MKTIFQTQDDYYKWLNEPEESIQDTVDTALEYISQLHETIKSLQKDIKDLQEYKDMYDDLCN